MPLFDGVSDRLTELQRQRALLQEHLAWLEKEIAAQSGANVSTPAGAQAAPQRAVQAAQVAGRSTPPSPIAAVTVIPTVPAAADADALIQQYGYDPKATSADVKRGCWFAFAGAFLVVGLVLTIWYLLRQS